MRIWQSLEEALAFISDVSIAHSLVASTGRVHMRQDGEMERVLGIGGYFTRAADPAALSRP